MNINHQLLQFIRNCPTSYHTVAAVKQRLLSEGYEAFAPSCSALTPGGKYFFEKSSAIFAFRVPQKLEGGFMIVAAHGDSPCFRLKYHRMLERGGALCLNTERYGGMNLRSWMDLPLAVAGRLVVSRESGLHSVLVDSEKPVCLIPGVAGHLMKEPLSPDPKTDLFPLYSCDEKGGDLLEDLCQTCGVDPSDVLGCDLYLYNPAPGLVWGKDEEFLSAPRLDDLQCVYAALEAFLTSGESTSVPLFCVFDNEEVGSSTPQGADSDTLPRLIAGLSRILTRGEFAEEKLLSSSFALSADNAHGVHPNHPELNDGKDRPVLNGGVVIKFNANRRYTTDGLSSALVSLLCRNEGISHQVYSNRSDLPGGSTLGHLMAKHFPVDCADIGLAQLSMHSAFETAGARDTDDMIRLMRRFFSTALGQDQGRLLIND